MNNLIFLFLFGVTDYSPNYNNLTLEEKQSLVVMAARHNLHFPELEYVDYTNGFDGFIYIARMRYNGTPLPYQADPILGQRRPYVRMSDYWKMRELGLIK